MDNTITPSQPRKDTYNVFVIQSEDKETLDKIQLELTDEGWILPALKEYQAYFKNSNPAERLVMDNTISMLHDLRTHYTVLTDMDMDPAYHEQALAWFQKEYQRIQQEIQVLGQDIMFEPKDGKDYLEQLLKLPAEITGYNHSVIKQALQGNALTEPDPITLFGFHPYLSTEELYDNYFNYERVNDETLIVGYPIEKGDGVEIGNWLRSQYPDLVIQLYVGNHQYAYYYVWGEDTESILFSYKEASPTDLIQVLNQLDNLEDVCHYYGYTTEQIEEIQAEESGFEIISGESLYN